MYGFDIYISEIFLFRFNLFPRSCRTKVKVSRHCRLPNVILQVLLQRKTPRTPLFSDFSYLIFHLFQLSFDRV